MMKMSNLLVTTTGPIGWCAAAMYYVVVLIYNKINR